MASRNSCASVNSCAMSGGNRRSSSISWARAAMAGAIASTVATGSRITPSGYAELIPEGHVVPRARPEPLVLLRGRGLHGVGVRRLRTREDGVGLLTGTDEVVLLAGQALDLGVGVQLGDLLVQGGVLLGQDVQAGVGRRQAVALLQVGAGGEHGE